MGVEFGPVENAWKFTSPKDKARIGFGTIAKEEKTAYYVMVMDEGAGFNPAYADKMFHLFKRLHSNSEFEGTGMRLEIERLPVSV